MVPSSAGTVMQLGGAGNDLNNRMFGNSYSVYLEGLGGSDYLSGGGGDYHGGTDY